MSAIWFTADPHLGHKLVAGLRGFGEDTDAHDAAIAANWDRVVKRDDHIWVLGDLSIGRGFSTQAALAWIGQRPGTKHLVWGNHDSGHCMHSGAHKAQAQYLEVFDSVQLTAVRKIGTERVMLNHMPFAADHTEVARYPEWRVPDVGQWLIHGHTHAKERQRGRELHVGLDAHALELVPLSWIAQRIAQGST